MEDDFDELSESITPEDPFHVEVDIYGNGDYSRLLVIPFDSKFIVVGNDEHLCTLTKSCDAVECWVQEEGSLDDELIERLGASIQNFSL